MAIAGAGAAQDVYCRFNVAGPVLAGRTDNVGIINAKSAPGGTLWGSFTALGARGQMVIGTGAAAAVAAGEVGISGASTATIGAAGAAAALPANPVGYITINVAGANMKIPYYNP